jgi:predicted dehydrogenase
MVERKRAGRVALVGYGFGGSTFHAPFIAAEPRLELVAVVTGNRQRQADVAARYSEARVLPRFEDLLACIDVADLVVVSTPNSTHRDIAEAVLTSGRPVVVDKPVATTAADVRRLAEMADLAGTVVVPFQNRRWDGDFRTVVALVNSRTIGVVHAFESRFERWQPQVRTGPDRSWKRDPSPSAGTGILYDLGSHVIDQAIVLFGRPASVYAEVGTRRPGAGVDDDVFVALQYPDGQRVHLWTSAIAADRGPRFRLLGSEGAYVKLGMDVQEAALIAGHLPTEPNWGEEPTTSWGYVDTGLARRAVPTQPGAYGLFYAGIAAYLCDGEPPPVDVADAVVTAEVIDAAYISARSGTVVSLRS